MKSSFKVGDIVYHAHGRNGKGVILEILKGCNLLYRVKFENKEFDSILPEMDLIG